MRHHLFFLLGLLLCAIEATAQRGGFLDRSEMIVAGGGMFYIGDLNDQTLFSIPTPAASIGVRTRIDNRWAARIELTRGRLQCDHDYLTMRNLSFRSDLTEGQAVLEFDFRPFGPGATEAQLSPYLFGGLGVFHFNPQARYFDGEGTELWADLQPLCTEGQGTSLYPSRHVYPLTQLCFPFGMGLRWRIGRTLSLNIEYGFRKTWTDYLDDVSTTYVGRDLLEAEVENGTLAADLADRTGEVATGLVNAVGIKRGDDSLRDWYSYCSISLGFNLETLFGWMRGRRCRN